MHCRWLILGVTDPRRSLAALPLFQDRKASARQPRSTLQQKLAAWLQSDDVREWRGARQRLWEADDDDDDDDDAKVMQSS